MKKGFLALLCAAVSCSCSREKTIKESDFAGKAFYGVMQELDSAGSLQSIQDEIPPQADDAEFIFKPNETGEIRMLTDSGFQSIPLFWHLTGDSIALSVIERANVTTMFVEKDSTGFTLSDKKGTLILTKKNR